MQPIYTEKRRSLLNILRVSDNHVKTPPRLEARPLKKNSKISIVSLSDLFFFDESSVFLHEFFGGLYAQRSCDWIPDEHQRSSWSATEESLRKNFEKESYKRWLYLGILKLLDIWFKVKYYSF